MSEPKTGRCRRCRGDGRVLRLYHEGAEGVLVWTPCPDCRRKTGRGGPHRRRPRVVRW